ncbi:MAG: transcriptional regulator GcvA [Proteobacteria bacterium]|nr:transcriptional regulator GcvA [Pseudomonadota bacterium]
MSRRLPPLNALRAFEAAARHLSVSKAARELNVTPAAVSHQVKALEEFLGIALFRRLNRALMLTDAGQTILPGLRDGFDHLAQAVGKLADQRDGNTLTVSTSPSFAAKWLVPRLDRFRAAHPHIELRIDATDRLVDLTRGEADVAIRYGTGNYPGMRAERLFTDESFPVCSPGLCKGPPPLLTPADLDRHALLHVDWNVQSQTAPSWRMWLLAAGADHRDAGRGSRFNQESMALQAAIEGHGVALASRVLAADDLAAGRLVRPFDLVLPTDFTYYLVTPETATDQPKIKAYFDWMIAETKPPPPA